MQKFLFRCGILYERIQRLEEIGDHISKKILPNLDKEAKEEIAALLSEIHLLDRAADDIGTAVELFAGEEE